MDKILSKNQVGKIVDYLLVLRQVYADDAMPPMIDEGDAQDKVETIDEILKYFK